MVVAFVTRVLTSEENNLDTISPQAENSTKVNQENPNQIYYWIGETNLKLGTTGGKSIWSLKVVKTKGEQGGEVVGPGVGAKVAVEIRDENKSTPITGVAGEDGWIFWETDFPKVGTQLWVTDVSGEYSWNSLDKAAAQKKSAAAHLSNTKGY